MMLGARTRKFGRGIIGPIRAGRGILGPDRYGFQRSAFLGETGWGDLEILDGSEPPDEPRAAWPILALTGLVGLWAIARAKRRGEL